METDPSSSANFSEMAITEMHLDWKVEIEKKMLTASVIHHMRAEKETNRVVLDMRHVHVDAVFWDGAAVPFKCIPVSLGEKLMVDLPFSLSAGQTGQLLVQYSITEKAESLQWLTKEQTSDGRAPFLFSQCQAIHARSLVPCMDTPSVKTIFTAKVRVPVGMTCLMGACLQEQSSDSLYSYFTFKQDIPIPSYLLSIVVGVLESHDLSPRSRVWAEPSLIQAAAYEFEPTEQFLKAAEEIAGEYVWKRYDMVVLPASFPYGGMENPCLTFVTPTIIAGDRSFIRVVAHEIAHSWTGNLVTNCNWNHFWLNEGFTVYFERKILEKVYGTRYRMFSAYHGFKSLKETMASLPLAFTSLRLNLGEVDPDDAFSSVPYEKGSALLLFLEQNVLTVEEAANFIREHVTAYKNTALSTEQWLSDMEGRFPALQQFLPSVKAWLFDPGLPPCSPSFDEEALLGECEAARANLLSDSPSSSLFSSLALPYKVFVIDSLASVSPPLEHSKLLLLSSPEFDLSSSSNCELLFSWLRLCVSAHFSLCIPAALAFARKYGRLKFCKKMYSLLFCWEEAREAAITQFEASIPSMHPITVQQVKMALQQALHPIAAP